MADSRVGIRLEATNAASGAINQVNTDLGALQQRAGAFGSGTGGGTFGDFTDRNTAQEFEGLASGITTLTAALGTLTAAVALGGALMDFGAQGAGIEAVRQQFNQLAADAGMVGPALLESMKESSRGAISDFDLMLAGNKALMLGVADTADEFDALLRFAEQRGTALGTGAAKAFEDVVTGIGRGSALILDNLAITPEDIADATDAYALSLGKASDELTDFEKKQALVNSVMAQAAEIQPTDASAQVAGYSSVNAELSNLRDNLAVLTNTGTAPAATAVASVVGGVNDGLEFLTRSTLDIERQLSDVTTALTTAEMNLGIAQQGIPGGGAEGMRTYTEALAVANQLMREQRDLQFELATAQAGVVSENPWQGVGPGWAATAESAAESVRSGIGLAMAEGTSAMETAVAEAEATYVPGMGGVGQRAGGEMVSGVSAALREGAREIGNTGNAAGREWGRNFLSVVGDNVPGQLIVMLTHLVTPLVAAQLRDEESRQGAQ